MLDSFYRDTVAEIDLDAVAHNVRAFRAWLPPRTAIMATVKANGYGHGAEPVAREALDNGATFLGVATLDEAIELQDAGIRAPILVMGYIPVRGLAEAIARKIRITVYDPDHAAQVKEASAAVGKRAVVHLKADTGMGRLGVRLHEVPPLVEQLLDTRFFELEGLFTHFARADERDKQYTHWQANNLKMILQKCKRMGASFSLVHCGNSAAAIDLPQYGFNMVRIGISLYGLYPSAEVKRQNVALKPVMSLKTKIVHVKRVQAGTGISYGSTYRTKKEETIATLPIGYADGYNRLLSNRGQALVQGKRVSIVGRICMDQTMLALPDGLKARVGDEVVLYGKQGGEELPVDEVAKWLGTINYEVTCMVNRRVPRVYMRNGRPVEVRVDTAKKL